MCGRFVPQKILTGLKCKLSKIEEYVREFALALLRLAVQGDRPPP